MKLSAENTQTRPMHAPQAIASDWSSRYGQRHRLCRVTHFPDSVEPPSKVRIYLRHSCYILQWWDPQAKRNMSTRVDGDLIDAIARARDIERRLKDFRGVSCIRKRLKHDELIQLYLEDLARRADADEIAVSTCSRYRSVLRHYQDFTGQPRIFHRFPFATSVDRDFALEFAAYLNGRTVISNGHRHASKRNMRDTGFVLDVVRAVFEWAANPDRGGHLPEGFRNPFRLSCLQRTAVAVDMTGQPDITTTMAADYLEACDDYQLALFAPIVCYGLRACEPVFLFHELIDEQWADVSCVGELQYLTKGRQNKKLPVIEPIAAFWRVGQVECRRGLVYVRRSAATGEQRPPLLGTPMNGLFTEYYRRCDDINNLDAKTRLRIRNELMHDAGALSYDHIHNEFSRVARKLTWPARATLKDFRHLFSTAMANGGMPEHERRYLMGHAPDKAAIVAYTHLNKIAEHYREAAERELKPVLQVLRARVAC